jgi:hypothetical protein
MPEKKFDPDERFSLEGMTGEEVMKKLLDPDKPKDDAADDDET